MDIQKNDKIEVTIESLGYKGEGVARLGRVPVFIDGALPGEKIRAHVILVKSSFVVAKLLEVVQPSAQRVKPRCPYFGKCGGCDIQHMSDGAQLDFKKSQVEDAFHKIARFDISANAVTPSDLTYGYRNKLSLPVRRGKNGAQVGLFAKNSHRIVEIDDCPLQSDRIREVLPKLKILANHFQPYDEEKGKGELRHFVLRDVGKLSLTVVLTRKNVRKLLWAMDETGLVTDELWLNVNNNRNNVILGDETILARGVQSQVDVLGLTTTVHPKGFMQVNNGVMRKVYTAVLDKAKEINPDLIIDAYSGGGTLTALLSRIGKRTIGVEIESVAVASANDLMAREGIMNVENVCGDCAEVLPELLKNAEQSNALIVLDPPRSGCDKKVISAVNDCGANDLLYVSCNPSTLARDVALLTNYSVTSVTPFDMFPQTSHVESVVLLSRTWGETIGRLSE